MADRNQLTPRTVRVLQTLAGIAVLAVVVTQVGARPFLEGLRNVTPGTVVAALALTALATVAAAWRWQLVAGNLGVRLNLGRAVAGYYRSQLLNSVLPAGVLGDVHRAAAHRTDAGMAASGRAVAGERLAGLATYLLIGLVAVAALPIPVGPAAIGVLATLTAAAVLASAVLCGARGGRSWAGIALSSLVVAAGHTAIMVVAARAAGVTSPLAQLLPVVIAILLAMVIPASVGGWGPREGVAAWLFAAAGWGAELGVAAATVYGVISLTAVLPGAGVLIADRLPRRPAADEPQLASTSVGDRG